jgi:hypothetical protein
MQGARSTPPEWLPAENRSRPCIARTKEHVTKRPLLQKRQNGNGKGTYILVVFFRRATLADDEGGGCVTTDAAIGGGGLSAYLRLGVGMSSTSQGTSLTTPVVPRPSPRNHFASSGSASSQARLEAPDSLVPRGEMSGPKSMSPGDSGSSSCSYSSDPDSGSSGIWASTKS